MIVWSGYGFLTAGIFLVCILTSNSLLSGVPYHPAIASIVAAVINWFVGVRINNRPGNVFKNEQTGHTFEVRNKSTFFWVAMEWWSVVMAILGILWLF